MDQIYFTADLHFGHPNILKHSPKRPYSDTVDIVAHDAWLLDLWCSTVDKRDTVYILGDLTFLKSEEARRLLYVGMTRAKRKLHLLYLKERFGKKQEPSRFLECLRR